MAKSNPIPPCTLLLRARTAFAGAPDADALRNKFIEIQRSDRPLRAWLLEDWVRPTHRLRRPSTETRQLSIGGHWWQRGLIVDANWRLAVPHLPEGGPHLPMDADWVAVRGYIEAVLDDGYDSDVWLEAEECRARLLRLDKSPEPEPRPIELPDDAASMLSGEELVAVYVEDLIGDGIDAAAHATQTAIDPSITTLPGYTVEQYERIRDWMLKWPEFWDGRGEGWRKRLYAAAKDELKDIKITAPLLQHVMSQYPEKLQKRRTKARTEAITSF